MILDLFRALGLKVYLKKLRLHKYCATFIKYSYEEFLQLNDETLKQDGVTLGARGKILKSIEKIRNRPQKLKELLITIEVVQVSSNNIFSDTDYKSIISLEEFENVMQHFFCYRRLKHNQKRNTIYKLFLMS